MILPWMTLNTLKEGDIVTYLGEPPRKKGVVRRRSQRKPEASHLVVGVKLYPVPFERVKIEITTLTTAEDTCELRTFNLDPHRGLSQIPADRVFRDGQLLCSILTSDYDPDPQWMPVSETT
ncbi:hypothetical protein HN588_03415 [Candidatus Bathyarchaeota archaeon]|mgnify:CR=1 FL=1|jgi:hypothetical protein|nr:hypothetical protein [Candidatus Bathyarchaeota archaeon]